MAAKTPKYISEHPLFDVHSYDIDLESNHIYLMGVEFYHDDSEPGVEFVMANRFIRNLNLLMRKSKDPILVHMKTCGGYWEEGMAIYDAIKACPNLVCILNYTHARSMSSIILQAADKRVMMPHSIFMFHEGTMSYEGTNKQYLTEAEQLKKANKQMMDIYVESMKAKGKYSKWGRQRIYNWIKNQMDKKEEVYLSAQESVELGFADEVFGEDGDYDWDSLLEFDEE